MNAVNPLNAPRFSKSTFTATVLWLFCLFSLFSNIGHACEPTAEAPQGGDDFNHKTKPKQRDKNQSKTVVSIGFSVSDIIVQLANSPPNRDQVVHVIGSDSTSYKTLFSKSSESNNADHPNSQNLGYQRQIASESVLSLGADYFLADADIGPEATVNQLKQTPIKQLFLSPSHTIAKLQKNIADIAQFLELDDQVLQEQVRHQAANLQQITTQPTQNQQATKPKGIYLFLQAGKPAQIAGQQTVADSLIQLLGAENPAHADINSYKPINIESIVAYQADFILMAQRHFDKFDSVENILNTFPLLRETPAGKNLAIYPIESPAIMGNLNLRTLQTAQNLLPLIYPQKAYFQQAATSAL